MQAADFKSDETMTTEFRFEVPTQPSLGRKVRD